MSSTERFLYLAHSPADLPQPVAQALQSQGSMPEAPDIVVIPPQEYSQVGAGWLGQFFHDVRRTPQRTLAFHLSQVTVVEVDRANALRVVVVPHHVLLGTDFATTLLYAYLLFIWTGPRGIDSIKIEFDSAGLGIIEEQLKHLRSLIAVPVPYVATIPPSEVRDRIAAQVAAGQGVAEMAAETAHGLEPYGGRDGSTRPPPGG